MPTSAASVDAAPARLPKPRASHAPPLSSLATAAPSFWDAYYTTTTLGDSPLTDAPSSFIAFCAPHINAPRTSGAACKVVEFGCGNGRDARWFVGQGFGYVGLDASPAAVDACRAAMTGAKRCAFQTGDFTVPDLLLADSGSADLVYSRFTLHSVDDDQEAGALANAFRLLKPGGRLMLEARSIRDPRCGLGACVGLNAYVDTHYRRFLDLDATIAKLEGAGFDVRVACEEVRAANFLADKAVVVRLVGVKPAALAERQHGAGAEQQEKSGRSRSSSLWTGPGGRMCRPRGGMNEKGRRGEG